MFDPVTLEVIWGRLVAAVDEAAATIVRTSFSTVVRESNDYACVLTDSSGNLLAENRGSIPAFCDCLGRTTKLLLERFPLASWNPGDAVITNDPWIGTGHLPDYTVISPIFLNGRIIGFAGCIAHNPDVGGSMWAADCTEIYEEGTRIPPLKLIMKGVANDPVVEIIRANSRVPNESIGDLMAQVSANEVMVSRVLELLRDVGMDNLTEVGAELIVRAETLMRDAVRAVPGGEYRSAVDLDGFEEPLRIECLLTVSGDQVTVDYTGTSQQVPRGINSVFQYTLAYTNYPLKCALDPHGPKNEGSYKPFRVVAPARSLLNPEFPAPVSARSLVGQLLSACIFSALAQAVPTKIIADSGSAPGLRTVFGGKRSDGTPFTFILFANGGMGARAHADGLSCTQYPSNTTPASIEVMEGIAPLIVWKKQMWEDSGGPGQYRGGLGQEIIIEVVSKEPIRFSVLSERHKFPAKGVLGGQDGTLATVALMNRAADLPRKGRTTLQPGDVLRILFPGGGGYGPPERRDHRMIADDLRLGLISQETAEAFYKFHV